MKLTEPASVFRSGQADWLQEKGAQDLTPEQQALLLALAQLEAEMGRTLSDAERAAIEALTDGQEGFDPEEIAIAIHQVVNTPANPDRQTSWSELKERIH